uniref:Uncharacterized protein n=1 Tax=Anguilla anguilla TaxID=7936 RepID=A0A0E9RIG0_ANGAN
MAFSTICCKKFETATVIASTNIVKPCVSHAATTYLTK